MDKYQGLQARYRADWKANTRMNRLTGAMHATVAAATRIIGKAQEIDKTDRLSLKGKIEDVRSFAQKDVVPALRRSAAQVDAMREESQKRRQALSVPAPDKTDVAAAVLRVDIRGWLKQLDQAGIASVLLDPETPEVVLMAAYEVPPAMIGATAQLMGQLQEHLVQTYHADEIAALDDTDEAIALVNATVQIALDDLRVSIGFRDGDLGQFNEWMAQASVDVERQLEQEFNRTPEAIAALVEDFAPTAAPKDIIDAIFARGFPNVYPDHSANKAA